MLMAGFMRAVLAVALVLVLGGCSSFRTEAFWGPAHKLSGLGTSYAWVPGGRCEVDANQPGYPDVERTLGDLIDARLKTLGYQNAESNPDFTVCYRLGKVVAQADAGLASWDDAIIEIVLQDPSSGERVWLGRARGEIDYSAEPGKRSSRLESAVKETMKPLPLAG